MNNNDIRFSRTLFTCDLKIQGTSNKKNKKGDLNGIRLDISNNMRDSSFITKGKSENLLHTESTHWAAFINESFLKVHFQIYWNTLIIKKIPLTPYSLSIIYPNKHFEKKVENMLYSVFILINKNKK